MGVVNLSSPRCDAIKEMRLSDSKNRIKTLLIQNITDENIEECSRDFKADYANATSDLSLTLKNHILQKLVPYLKSKEPPLENPDDQKWTALLHAITNKFGITPDWENEISESIVTLVNQSQVDESIAFDQDVRVLSFLYAATTVTESWICDVQPTVLRNLCLKALPFIHSPKQAFRIFVKSYETDNRNLSPCEHGKLFSDLLKGGINVPFEELLDGFILIRDQIEWSQNDFNDCMNFILMRAGEEKSLTQDQLVKLTIQCDAAGQDSTKKLMDLIEKNHKSRLINVPSDVPDDSDTSDNWESDWVHLINSVGKQRENFADEDGSVFFNFLLGQLVERGNFGDYCSVLQHLEDAYFSCMPISRKDPIMKVNLLRLLMKVSDLDQEKNLNFEQQLEISKAVFPHISKILDTHLSEDQKLEIVTPYVNSFEDALNFLDEEEKNKIARGLYQFEKLIPLLANDHLGTVLGELKSQFYEDETKLEAPPQISKKDGMVLSYWMGGEFLAELAKKILNDSDRTDDFNAEGILKLFHGRNLNRAAEFLGMDREKLWNQLSNNIIKKLLNVTDWEPHIDSSGVDINHPNVRALAIWEARLRANPKTELPMEEFKQLLDILDSDALVYSQAFETIEFLLDRVDCAAGSAQKLMTAFIYTLNGDRISLRLLDSILNSLDNRAFSPEYKKDKKTYVKNYFARAKPVLTQDYDKSALLKLLKNDSNDSLTRVSSFLGVERKKLWNDLTLDLMKSLSTVKEWESEINEAGIDVNHPCVKAMDVWDARLEVNGTRDISSDELQLFLNFVNSPDMIFSRVIKSVENFLSKVDPKSKNAESVMSALLNSLKDKQIPYLFLGKVINLLNKYDFSAEYVKQKESTLQKYLGNAIPYSMYAESYFNVIDKEMPYREQVESVYLGNVTIEYSKLYKKYALTNRDGMNSFKFNMKTKFKAIALDAEAYYQRIINKNDSLNFYNKAKHERKLTHNVMKGCAEAVKIVNEWEAKM